MSPSHIHFLWPGSSIHDTPSTFAVMQVEIYKKKLVNWDENFNVTPTYRILTPFSSFSNLHSLTQLSYRHVKTMNTSWFYYIKNHPTSAFVFLHMSWVASTLTVLYSFPPILFVDNNKAWKQCILSSIFLEAFYLVLSKHTKAPDMHVCVVVPSTCAGHSFTLLVSSFFLSFRCGLFK